MKLTIDQAYKIIGVNIGCDDATLKEAFRKLSLKLHPDRNNGQDEEFKKLVNAKEVVDQHRKNGGQATYNVNGRVYTEAEILQEYFRQMRDNNARAIFEMERRRKQNYIQVNTFVLRVLATMMTLGLYILFHMLFPGLFGSIMRIVLLTVWITTLAHAKAFVEYLYEKEIKKK